MVHPSVQRLFHRHHLVILSAVDPLKFIQQTLHPNVCDAHHRVRAYTVQTIEGFATNARFAAGSKFPILAEIYPWTFERDTRPEDVMPYLRKMKQRHVSPTSLHGTFVQSDELTETIARLHRFLRSMQRYPRIESVTEDQMDCVYACGVKEQMLAFRIGLVPLERQPQRHEYAR